MAQLTSEATAGSPELAETPGPSRAAFSAWAALLVVWLVWGSTYLAIRVADRSIPPFAMAAARYLTAGAVLYPVVWLASRRRQAAAHSPGSASWGIGSVLAGRLPAPASPLVGSGMEMLTGGIVLTGLAAATGELTHIDPAHVSTQSLLGLLYLIGPGSLLALTCYVIALRRLPTAAVSTYAYVNPVIAVSLGALFLGERPTLATLFGGAVVVLSVAMLLIRRTGRPPAE